MGRTRPWFCYRASSAPETDAHQISLSGVEARLLKSSVNPEVIGKTYRYYREGKRETRLSYKPHRLFYSRVNLRVRDVWIVAPLSVTINPRRPMADGDMTLSLASCPCNRRR